MAVGYLCVTVSKARIDNWLANDPTSPGNMADPNFKPPPKKEKKFKAIRDRFEILDL